MTYTWTDNAMQSGTTCDVDKVNNNLHYLQENKINKSGDTATGILNINPNNNPINQIGDVGYTILANGSTITFSPNSAKLFSVHDGSGHCVLFHAEYSSSTITKLSDPSNYFTTTDSGTAIRVFKSSNSHQITVRNSLGSNSVVAICLHGSGVISWT